jgi:multidrug resistance efflux pump
MKKLKQIMIILGVVALIAGIAAIAYYVYEGNYYFSTNNAQVSADMVSITPEITGAVTKWQVQEGDYVKAGQSLGKQDISALITSSALNPQTMTNAADSIISKADIKTPISGKVVQSSVIEGEMVSPGMELAIIANTSHFYIKANIEETNIFKIQQGQKVDIDIDAYPNQTFHGYVEKIGQATQSAFSTMPSLNTSGTYTKVTQLIEVHINITEAEKLSLMPGMNATVKIHIK